jgi:large subunit ribosomal protein L22
MNTKAELKYVRISPQKVRKIIGAVKGMPVEEGLARLKFMPQKAARIVEKIVHSAVANAEQGDIDVDTLEISNITADQGPVLKRYKARARGRGTRIIKRTSHITVFLSGETA